MAKVTEYSRITKMKDNDVLLVDGPDGTRTILQTDASKQMGESLLQTLSQTNGQFSDNNELLSGSLTDKTSSVAGVNYSLTGNVLTVNGTATATSFFTVLGSTTAAPPLWLIGEKQYIVKITNNTSAEIWLQCKTTSNDTLNNFGVYQLTGQYIFTVPADVTVFRIGIYVSRGNTVNGTITIEMFNVIKLSDLKESIDDVTEYYGKNLINQAELLTIPGWTVTDNVYQGTLGRITESKIATVNGGFTVYAPFEENTRYIIGFKASRTGSTTTGNGIRVNFNFTDGTQVYTTIPNAIVEERDFTYSPDFNGRTLAFISFGYGTNTANVWYIREMYLVKYDDAHIYTPFENSLSAIDKVVRANISAIVSDMTNLSESVIPFYNFKNGLYYNIGSGSVNIDEPGVNTNYKCIAIPCEEGDRFMPIIYAYGSASRRWGFATENGIILMSEGQLSAGAHVINNGEIITAPKNAKYLLCNHRIYNYNNDLLTFNPIIYKLNKYDAINEICTDVGLLPKIATGWKSQVIAVWDKYIAIYEENTVKISNNYGDNFDYSIDVSNIGTIKHCRFYANGTIAIFTTNKAYYSDNYSTLNESALYNSDGSAFSSDTEYNFDVAGESKTRKYLNGVDMCVFGNYTLSTATTREMIWYSIDNGHSYKIAYEFNITGNYAARHVHEVYYYEAEDVFLVLTGDAQASECRVLGAKYNAENDTWDISSLSGETSSRNFKWSYVDTWDGYLYYSHDVAPGSIKRCKFEDISDISKHEVILSEIPNDVTLAAFGPAGDMIVIQSVFRSLGGATSEATLSQYECSRKIYYSSDRKSFSEIVIPPIILNDVSSIPFWYQPVQNHIISGTWWTTQESKLPSIFIDDIVRASGFPKAFMPL